MENNKVFQGDLIQARLKHNCSYNSHTWRYLGVKNGIVSLQCFFCEKKVKVEKERFLKSNPTIYKRQHESNNNMPERKTKKHKKQNKDTSCKLINKKSAIFQTLRIGDIVKLDIQAMNSSHNLILDSRNGHRYEVLSIGDKIHLKSVNTKKEIICTCDDFIKCYIKNNNALRRQAELHKSKPGDIVVLKRNRQHMNLVKKITNYEVILVDQKTNTIFSLPMEEYVEQFIRTIKGVTVKYKQDQKICKQTKYIDSLNTPISKDTDKKLSFKPLNNQNRIELSTMIFSNIYKLTKLQNVVFRLQLIDSTNNHVSKGHHIKNIKIVLAYKQNPKIDTISIFTLKCHYCVECNKYFDFYNSFLEQLEKKHLDIDDLCFNIEKDGVIIHHYRLPVKYTEYGEESVLHAFGYKVGVTGISLSDRRKLLKWIIDSQILSIAQIKSIINTDIRMFKNRPQYSIATKEWFEDLEYINSFI